MRFENFLFEETLENFYLMDGEKNASKVVLFTSRLDNHKHTNTIDSFVKLLKEKNIEHYIAYTDDSYITRDKKKDDILKIHNVDDDKGFIINSKNTLIITRASVAYSTACLDMVSQLEKNRFFCVNNRNCLESCGDKFRTGLKLTDLGISTPRTSMIRNEEGLMQAHKNVGGKFPVILKTLTGTKGKGVMLAESWKNMLSVLQTIWNLNPNEEILIQEYIKSDGDYRIHVLGDEVIASMKRTHGDKEFRANYSLGGNIEKVEDLDSELKDLAIKASKVVGGIWTGVDIIVSAKTNKPYVLEVNSSPGTEGIEKASKIPVTSLVLEYILNKQNWRIPTVTCGYIENVWIDNLGFLKAKFDTGNGALSSIHADSYEIKDGKINWIFKGKTYKNDLVEIRRIKIGGLKSGYDERPVIKLNVTFNGETFYNIKFCLTNRINNEKKNKSEILFNRTFMNYAGLNIDPSNTYLLSLRRPEENKKENA